MTTKKTRARISDGAIRDVTRKWNYEWCLVVQSNASVVDGPLVDRKVGELLTKKRPEIEYATGAGIWMLLVVIEITKGGCSQ